MVALYSANGRCRDFTQEGARAAPMPPWSVLDAAKISTNGAMYLREKGGSRRHRIWTPEVHARQEAPYICCAPYAYVRFSERVACKLSLVQPGR